MVMVKEFVKLRIIEGGKVISEICSGDDLWRKQGKWMNLNRVIDWRNDRYRKTIKDPQSGEVVHHCDEKLSDHQGHGSAKKRV
jgi:hypothetical protein